jgi:ABC-type multidrug transport system ATPase subunit
MPAFISIAGYSDPPRIPLLSMEVNRGEMVAVAGPPGSGKSNLMGALAGIRNPARGTIRILGQRAGEAAGRLRSVFVFQDHNFDPGRTVWSQLAARLPLWGGSAGENRQRLEAWCHACGLLEAAGREPGRMNLAQLRFLALAPVALCNPSVAVLDEPLVGLPAEQAGRALSIILAVREKGTVLVMTQEDSSICGAADRVVVLP